MSSADIQHAKRLLRLRIGRLRRRIDGRIHGLQGQGRRLASWKTYATRYPVYAALVATGLGLAVAAGFRRGAWLRLLGRQLTRRAAGNMVDSVFAELKAIWDEASPGQRPANSEGADHGRF